MDRPTQIRHALAELADPAEHAKITRRAPPGDVVGVRMREVFALAKAHADLPLDEVEELLESSWYEHRMVAVSILDARARQRRTTEPERDALAGLYLRRHDRIDTWDLVDRAAPWVVGRWLRDRPRDVLHALAASADLHERRTAMVACFWLVRDGDVEDALAVARVLVDDEPINQNTVGTALREVGRVAPERRDAFLAEHGDRLHAGARRVALSG